mmetsp:Transcript_5152/g.4833  ORF Transcript_5152/g.4833 Transcript_5152/m.4833 type:complete len:80 (+) Transcript_5152:53-292(+)
MILKTIHCLDIPSTAVASEPTSVVKYTSSESFYSFNSVFMRVRYHRVSLSPEVTIQVQERPTRVKDAQGKTDALLQSIK